jgi:hypothetical protein
VSEGCDGDGNMSVGSFVEGDAIRMCRFTFCCGPELCGSSCSVHSTFLFLFGVAVRYAMAN